MAMLVGMTGAAAGAGDVTWGDWVTWGDQGDGTYRNPVLPADFSDLDCIRVGADYYAISSTFQFSPGMVVLHSRDLVNWSILGHVVKDLGQISPELNWDRMNRYGRGVWAGAIRYHARRYWVYHLYDQSGLVAGRDLDNWLEAKACLCSGIPKAESPIRAHQNSQRRK